MVKTTSMKHQNLILRSVMTIKLSNGMLYGFSYKLPEQSSFSL